MANVVICGHIRMACGGAVVPRAEVFACHQDWRNYRQTTADDDGYYQFTGADGLLEGRHTLDVFAPGFDFGNVTFVVGTDTSRVDVFLAVLPNLQDQTINVTIDPA